MSAPRIRPATRSDGPGILAIYNDAVRTTTATYDETPRTLEQQELWLEAHERAQLPVLVAEAAVSGGPPRISGWSSLSRWQDRAGYRFTAETSIYVAAADRGRGVGTLLMAPLIAAAAARGMHVLLALVDAANEPSLRLHARFGFVPSGHLREVGYKFGRWLDVILLERRITGRDADQNFSGTPSSSTRS